MQDKMKTVIVPPGSTDLDRIFDVAKAERSVRVRIGNEIFTVTYESTKLSTSARDFLTRGGVVDE
jgi:hypothetical protein